MRTIWKYTIPAAERFTLVIPRDYTLLDVQAQDGMAMLWVLVESDSPSEAVAFVVLGTGHPYPDPSEGDFVYVGTFQMQGGQFVFHLFSREPAPWTN